MQGQQIQGAAPAQKQQGQGFQGNCYWCGKWGHSATNCFPKQNGSPQVPRPPQGWQNYGRSQIQGENKPIQQQQQQTSPPPQN